MAISQLPQAPYRQDRKTFPTSLVADVIFSEVRDCNRSEFPAFGTLHPNSSKWPDHKLVFIKPVDIERNEIFEFYYAADRENQDLYNWQFKKADIGGTKFDAITRIYATPRNSFAPTALTMGDSMPNVPKNLFSGVYVLAEQQQTYAKEEVLNSIYVFEEHTYIQKTTFVKIDYDEAFGQPLKTLQNLYYKDEIVIDDPETTIEELFADQSASYWGLQSTGIQRSGDQLTSNWFVVTEQEVIPSDIALYGRTYSTTENYNWPPVLDAPLFSINTFTTKTGEQKTYFEPRWKRFSYGGPCKATVFQRFYVSPPAVSAPVQMLPLPIDISNPFAALRVPPSLHTSAVVTYSTGTADPVYDYIVITMTIPTTNYTDWPETVIASDSVQPTRGGYLRTTITIDRPA